MFHRYTEDKSGRHSMKLQQITFEVKQTFTEMA